MTLQCCRSYYLPVDHYQAKKKNKEAKLERNKLLLQLKILQIEHFGHLQRQRSHWTILVKDSIKHTMLVELSLN